MRITAAPTWPSARPATPAVGARREAPRPIPAAPVVALPEPPEAAAAPKSAWEKKKEQEEKDRLSDPKLETMRLLLARLTGKRAKLLHAKDLQPKTKAAARPPELGAPPVPELAEAIHAAAETFAARRLDVKA